MARERVEVVRGVLDEFARGEFRGSVRLFDPNTLLVIRPEFPEWGAYLGPEAIAGYTRELITAYRDFTIKGLEYLDAGDTVVARVHQSGHGLSSGALTEHSYYMLFTFRGEKIVRIEAILDRAEALTLAGLGG
jgi:ketosteroid isomerase-like protein